MKTNIFFVIFAFLVVMTITGCENDIDLKADDTTGLLCINGNLTAGASVNYVNVSVTGKSHSNNISNAKVVISVNGSEVETITEVRPDNQFFYRTDGDYPVTAKFSPGDYVQVDVYYGEQHAYGGGVVPQPVTYATVKADYKENVPYKIDMWSSSYSFADMAMVETTIADKEPYTKNYFRMAISHSDSMKTRVDKLGHYLNDYSWSLSEVYDSDEVKDGYYMRGYYSDYDKYKYYFDNDPVLSAEVVKSQGDISFVDAVDNVYKIFNDNFFDGATATLNVMCPVYLNWDMSSYRPLKYYYNKFNNMWDNWNLVEDISYYAPHYTHKVYVDIYSISEDEYYYLKVLNARGPDSYFEFDSDFSLTGDVKLPSNVKGGTGNIFLSSCFKTTGCLYEDYVPEYAEISEPENFFIYYDDSDNDYGENYYEE